MTISYDFFDIDLQIGSHLTNRRKKSEGLFLFVAEELGEFIFLGPEKIVFYPSSKDYSQDLLKVYLNGTILGIFLILKKIVAFHGSSFQFKNKGILVIGESEAGKSTTTLNFCLHGAKFISDDISPVIFEDNKFKIKSLKDNLKIWKDAFEALQIKSSDYKNVWGEDDKFVFEKKYELSNSNLDIIFLLSTHHQNNISIKELTNFDKFKVLRENIYCQEYLFRFPKSEKFFFDKVVELSNLKKVFEVKRPYEINPTIIFDNISKIIENLYN